MGARWGADRGVVRQKVRHVSGAAMERPRSATGNQSVGNKAPNILVECEAAVGILGKQGIGGVSAIEERLVGGRCCRNGSEFLTKALGLVKGKKTPEPHK